MPRPADVVAATPTVADEATDAEPVPQEATAPAEVPQPETPPEPPQEEVAEQDSGDVLATEATEATEELLAPTSSPRPPRRPERVAEAPEPAPAPDPEPDPEEPASDPDADAIAAAVAEAAAAEAAQEPAAPAGPPMTFGEIDGLRAGIERCWNVAALSSEALRVRVTLAVDVAPDGRPVAASIRQIAGEGGSDVAINAAYEAARRAVLTCGRQGFPLPADKYDQWRQMELTFDASGMQFR
jgi:outer membrane biosynthesis protein TonB